MATIPLAANNLRPIPQQEGPLSQYAAMQQILGMQQQRQMQSQQIQGAQQENQLRGIQLKNAQISSSALSDPDFQKNYQAWQSSKGGSSSSAASTGNTSAAAAGPMALHPLAQFLADTKGLSMFGAGGALDLSNQLTETTQKMATLAKTQADVKGAGLDNYKKQLGNFDDLVEPVLAETDPAKQTQGLANVQQQITEHPELYPQEATQHLDKLGTVQGLQTASNVSTVRQMLIEDATKQADKTKAQQGADPVAQLSTPQALADPGAQAAIQAKIADPATKPEDVPRLQALMPKAAIAQQNAANIKARDERAQQAISQGDPNAAGQLLASRAMTIDELKLRNATPDFMEKAVMAAQKIDPSFKAAEASAQGKIAASSANQQFFGNTDSLLVKGGTLDQLQAAGDALGNSMIPKYNTLANWTKAALGQGPQAAYAAKALGVADDYSKVMGSGTGTDTGRQQALDVISRDLSPQGRQAGTQAIRETVASQREGRIGTNPYLRDMYPDPQAATGSQPKPQPSAQVPAAVQSLIGKAGDGRHTLSDGSVWDKRGNSITQVSGAK